METQSAAAAVVSGWSLDYCSFTPSYHCRQKNNAHKLWLWLFKCGLLSTCTHTVLGNVNFEQTSDRIHPQHLGKWTVNEIPQRTGWIQPRTTLISCLFDGMSFIDSRLLVVFPGCYKIRKTRRSFIKGWSSDESSELHISLEHQLKCFTTQFNWAGGH